MWIIIFYSNLKLHVPIDARFSQLTFTVEGVQYMLLLQFSPFLLDFWNLKDIIIYENTEKKFFYFWMAAVTMNLLGLSRKKTSIGGRSQFPHVDIEEKFVLACSFNIYLLVNPQKYQQSQKIVNWHTSKKSNILSIVFWWKRFSFEHFCEIFEAYLQAITIKQTCSKFHWNCNFF